MVKTNGFFKVMLSAIRHRWLVYFRPLYTIDSLLKRKGNCKACGSCCIQCLPSCRYLKENRCQCYDRQPFFCKIFPIDQKDQEMSGVKGECGYYW